MIIRRDSNIIRSSVIAAVLLILGLIITQLTNYAELGFVFIVMGLIAFITVIHAATRPKKNIDERTKRVNEKAGYYAFIVLCFVIGTIGLLDMYLPLNLKLKDVTPSFWAVAIWGWIISRWHLNKKTSNIE